MEITMKRARHLGLGIVAAAGLVLATSAFAQPGEGGRMGHGATGGAQAHERHAGMNHERMAQRMAQHRGGHAEGAQAGAAQGGCPMMGAQAGAQAEHKH
jgi:hypothetical protein